MHSGRPDVAILRLGRRKTKGNKEVERDGAYRQAAAAGGPRAASGCRSGLAARRSGIAAGAAARTPDSLGGGSAAGLGGASADGESPLMQQGWLRS